MSNRPKKNKINLSPQYEEVKSLTLKAMVSDDILMERLVLKGGSALQMVYDMSERGSLDLDFSMSDDLDEAEEAEIESRMRAALEQEFNEADLKVFDFAMTARPQQIRPEVREFWGGYAVEFKVLPTSSYNLYADASMRSRSAMAIGANGSTKFKVDISSYEYCDAADRHMIDGLELRVYSPKMIAYEKARAVCQQLPDYRAVVGSHASRPRSRDFFDIYLLAQNYDIGVGDDESMQLLRLIFEAKRVPLSFLAKVESQRKFHKEDFDKSLVDTLSRLEDYAGFDEYFDFFIDTFCSSEVLNSAG